MSMRGHNENAMRLSMLADDAQRGLERVAKGEADAIDGWLAYGAALNEGRSLFAEDRAFGQWIAENLSSNLEVHPAEQSAAIWAAAHRDQFDEARAAGKARTVRGIHDKWKQIEDEREREARESERKVKDAEARAEAEAKRKEAEQQQKVEAEARVAAAAAETEEARVEAEAKAEEAAAAKAEAEEAVERAEAAIAAATPEEDGETAKQRRALAKLTPEALVDEVLGLRADLADAKAAIAAAKAEADVMKADLAAFRQPDMGRALGNAQRLARAAEGRMREFQATAVRLDRRVKLLEAENKRLKAEIEQQVVTL